MNMFLVPQLGDFVKAEGALGPRAPRPVSVSGLDTGHSMSLVLQPLLPSKIVRASVHIRFHVGQTSVSADIKAFPHLSDP